jgi:hypothetical protein
MITAIQGQNQDFLNGSILIEKRLKKEIKKAINPFKKGSKSPILAICSR